MEDIKYYQLVSSAVSFYDKKEIANYTETRNFKSEIKAINAYKDTVWNMQGIINNSIVVNDNFSFTSSVILYALVETKDNISYFKVMRKQIFTL